jgi:hypothetical protein
MSSYNKNQNKIKIVCRKSPNLKVKTMMKILNNDENQLHGMKNEKI